MYHFLQRWYKLPDFLMLYNFSLFLSSNRQGSQNLVVSGITSRPFITNIRLQTEWRTASTHPWILISHTISGQSSEGNPDARRMDNSRWYGKFLQCKHEIQWDFTSLSKLIRTLTVLDIFAKQYKRVYSIENTLLSWWKFTTF